MRPLIDKKFELEILGVRILTPNTFVLRLERKDISFVPGQHMVIGFPGEMENREYSIYSGLEDSYLDFLIKEVDGGLVSSRLISLRKGDKLSIQGPYGFFVIPEDTINKKHNF